MLRFVPVYISLLLLYLYALGRKSRVYDRLGQDALRSQSLDYQFHFFAAWRSQSRVWRSQSVVCRSQSAIYRSRSMVWVAKHSMARKQIILYIP